MTDSPEPAGHRLEQHDPFPLGPEVLRPPPRTGLFGRFAIVNGRLPDIFLTPHFTHRASDVCEAGWMAMSCSFICEAPSRGLQEFPIDVLLRQTAPPRKQLSLGVRQGLSPSAPMSAMGVSAKASLRLI